MKNLICRILGHNFYTVRKLEFDCRKVGCRRCGRFWGYNPSIEAFIAWDQELEALHDEERDPLERMARSIAIAKCRMAAKR